MQCQQEQSETILRSRETSTRKGHATAKAQWWKGTRLQQQSDAQKRKNYKALASETAPGSPRSVVHWPLQPITSVDAALQPSERTMTSLHFSSSIWTVDGSIERFSRLCRRPIGLLRATE